jgi:hypothetical protein
MKSIGVFLLSLGAHWMSFLVFLWVGLLLGNVRAVILLLSLHLIVVAVLGYAKALRWPTRWSGAFATGLAVAAVGATLLVIGLEYVFSFPVPDRLAPPPFWNFVVDHELGRKNAILWMAIPIVVWSITSAIGHAFGSSAQRHRQAA